MVSVFEEVFRFLHGWQTPLQISCDTSTMSNTKKENKNTNYTNKQSNWENIFIPLISLFIPSEWVVWENDDFCDESASAIVIFQS
jgi:hypothetical protein